MTQRILPDALDDARSTAARLEREHAGFGLAFSALFDAAADRCRDTPRLFSPTDYGPDGVETREVFMPRFNQRVIYAVTDAEVVILAVVHAHSRPGAWTDRVEQV